MWSFKKRIEGNIKKHSDELVTLSLGINTIGLGLNEQILRINRLIDAVSILDRKIDLLAKCFQLEYNGETYVKRKK